MGTPWILLLVLAIAGCNTTTVRTTEHEAAVSDPAQFAEHELLDVGVGIFDPGTAGMANPEEEGVFPKIREAEARFMPYRLMETLQGTGNWGAVRVVPDRLSQMDLWVDGKILKSDGATLGLQITVTDATGRQWFTKKYEETASKYSYADDTATRIEPFQGLYNQIANDMLAYLRIQKPGVLGEIRRVSELRFAQDFAPEAFSGYVERDRNGRYRITRLPAENDPLLARVREVRERDAMFVDTLQEYYGSFVREMEQPYREWRQAFYVENEALKQVRADANKRLIGGALAVLAGILAQGVDSRTARTAGWVGIGAGATAVMSGLNKREQAKIHAEALEEISTSLNSELEPHTMTLQNRTVTLTGNVQEQYRQWREILRDIYVTETGQAGPVTN
jgi:hypothetical protein